MRFVVVIAALCLLQIALAADPNPGATVLQPSSGAGNGTRGTTVLTPSGSAPVGDCVTGSKGCAKQSNPSDPIAPPPPGMNVAIVIRPKGDCGCDKDEVDCKCEKQKFVEPEIREPPKNCTCTEGEENCACLRSFRKKRVHETVAPEQAPNHVVPEVRGKVYKAADCANGNPCQPQPEFVQPEIKKGCACANQDNVDCPCNFLKPNF